MKLFILLIAIAGFIQSSIWNIDLVLVLVISRALLSNKRSTYLTAFLAGIFLSLLTAKNIGFYAIIFVFYVKLLQLIKHLPFSTHLLTIIPVAAILFTTTAYLEQLLLGQSLNLNKIITEVIITLPIYLFVSFWEDRFFNNKDIRLKIR